MNLLSRDPGKEKVQCIRAKTLPAVVTMPSRSTGAESRGAAVLQMPSRLHAAVRKTPVLITMPSRSRETQQRASLVEMPSRAASVQDADDSAGGRVKSQSDRLGMSDSLRMTLIALFALLGWPRPTHGKDPGAAGARPWKLELLNVISKLQLPTPANGRKLAAQGAGVKVPQQMPEELHRLASAA